MTAGLSGAGTEANPWIIQSGAQLLVVLRDAATAGFYRLEVDLPDHWPLAPVVLTSAGSYLGKVIDLNGNMIKLTGAATTTDSFVVAGVQFKNGSIEFFYTSPSADSRLRMLHRSPLVDVAVRVRFGGLFSGDWYVVSAPNVPSGLPAVMRRAVFFSSVGGLLISGMVHRVDTSGVVLERCFVYSDNSNWPTAGIPKIGALTVAALDAATGGVFSLADWEQAGVFPIPAAGDLMQLSVVTNSAGSAVSRRVWLVAQAGHKYLGATDAQGVGQFQVRVKKRRVFCLLASEDLSAPLMLPSLLVEAQGIYAPPASNGFVYRASGAGAISSFAGVTFADQPFTVEGITFTPVACYSAIAKSGLSVARGGLSQTVILDGAGGGGPVIDGDPAYLDGVVEEVHPMLGSLRPLANAEVIAFERRGGEYVAMGSSYSNAFGEFRVETEVYGGGDIFAFAADFPGVIWQAGIALSIGTRLRPVVNNGYVYEVVTAGNSGATEPVWWADEGDGTEGSIGSATATARPYYQPVGHGPLKMTLVE